MIVDEAYIDFAGRSALELIDKYDNLIVVRHFPRQDLMAGMPRIALCYQQSDIDQILK